MHMAGQEFLLHTRINSLTMRELINILTESRGLGARARGETFKSTTSDQEIYFRAIKFFPEGGGKYETPELLDQALQQVIDSMGDVEPTEVSRRDAGTGAFGIALFDTAADGTGPILAYLKYYKQVNPDPTTNAWDNQTGIPGFRYASKTAIKAQAGMMPQDVLSKLDDLTAQDIVEQITLKFPNTGLADLAQHLAAGGSLPYSFAAPSGMSFTAFRDYFCELLHPIALQTGQYTGEAAQAEQIFLGEKGFADCTISFGGTKTEGLSDSIMINSEGRRIKVSSKGKAGAAASANNLLDAANELAQTDAGKKLVEKYKDTLDLIALLKQAGQAAAPGVVAVKYNILTAEEAKIIQDIKRLPLVDINNIDSLEFLTPTLKKLARSRETKTPSSVNLYFHLIAAVAHEVEKKINTETNFGKDAADILNHSGLVQVYTLASERSDTWTLNKFDTRYPGTAITGVKISAHKTYYSTGIKGNFTFKVLRGGAQDLTTGDAAEIEPTAATPLAKPAALTGKRVDIAPPAAERAKREPTAKGLGRERR